MSLTKSCRVEMPGIYFDVDLATLKPASNRALTTIAELLRKQPQWRLSIEGHTDNTGGDAHNEDLSTRRAAAVKAALVRDFAIASGRLTSAGFGERRPVETNDTMAGERATVASNSCVTAPEAYFSCTAFKVMYSGEEESLDSETVFADFDSSFLPISPPQ
jgi:hypothetical protein